MSLTAVLTAFELAKGAYDLYQSSQYAKKERPDYEIPESERKRLGMMQMLASDRKMPGEDRLLENIRTSTANALKNVKEMGGASQILSMIGRLQSGENASLSNLGIASAQDYERRQAALRDELGRMAQYEEKAWNINKMQPYQESMKTASDFEKAGWQNLTTGLSTAAGVEQADKYWENMFKLYGKQEAPGGTQTGNGILDQEQLNRITGNPQTPSGPAFDINPIYKNAMGFLGLNTTENQQKIPYSPVGKSPYSPVGKGPSWLNQGADENIDYSNMQWYKNFMKELGIKF